MIYSHFSPTFSLWILTPSGFFPNSISVSSHFLPLDQFLPYQKTSPNPYFQKSPNFWKFIAIAYEFTFRSVATFLPKFFSKNRYAIYLSTRHTCKIGISDDELNDYYDMATHDKTIWDKQLRKIFIPL